MKKFLITLSVMLFSFYSFSQCQLSCGINGTSSHTLDICIGDSLTLNAVGGCSILMSNDFNNGTIGPGWSANCSPMFNNPCNAVGGTADGTPYCWIGPASNFPRELATVGYNLNCPGSNVNIQFDMKYAQQGDATPCEGPDLTTEGVHLQYWNYGAVSWTEIQYWDPLGGYQANFISWQHYSVNVPAAANSILTSFRWFQTNTSGNDYDHWGIDNVLISFAPTPTNSFSWWEGTTQITTNQDYTFTPTTTGQHVYIARVENTCGLFMEDSVMVNVTPIPNANFTASSPICIDGTSTVLYNGNASSSATYDWNFDNANVISGSSQGPTELNWSTPGQHIITLQVSENGCFSPIDSVPVDVYSSPIPNFTATPKIGCAPLTVNFADSSFPTIQSWLWDFGDVASSNNSSTLQNPTHSYVDSGWYDVKLVVQSTATCIDSITIPNFIHVLEPPVAEFSASPTTTSITNPLISFTNQSQFSTSWIWNFGDVSSAYNSSSAKNTAHSYTLDGTYTIWLVSSNGYCSDSINHSVIINPVPPVIPEIPYSFYIPNAFSPNGEGTNEIFIPLGEGIDSSYYEMCIFDRWGELIFDTKDILTGWNGKRNNSGSTLPSGIYVYLFKVRQSSGIKHNYAGSVLLFR